MSKKNIFLQASNDLLEIQKSGFYAFLSSGILDSLKVFKTPFSILLAAPTRAYAKHLFDRYAYCVCHINTEKYWLGNISANTKKCLEHKLNYTVDLIVEMSQTYNYDEYLDQIFNNVKENKKIKILNIKRKIIIAKIPLMTPDCSFIINGCERVLVNTLEHQSGFNLVKTLNPKTGMIENFILFKHKNAFLKFAIDPKNNILNGFINKFKNNENDTKNTLKKIKLIDLLTFFNTSATELFLSENWLTVVREEFALNDMLARENSKKSIKFQNHLDKKGNLKLNNFEKSSITILKNIISVDTTNPYLTLEDLYTISLIIRNPKIKIFSNNDIDHLKNKKMITVFDYLISLLNNTFYTYKNKITKHNSHIKQILLNIETKESRNFENKLKKSEKLILNSEAIDDSFINFFNTNEKSQYLDQINDLSTISHSRKILLSKDNKKAANVELRDVHASQYNRLCPIETTEGKNAGLTANLSLYSRIDSSGLINSPVLHNKNVNKTILSKIYYINAKQESNLVISPFSFVNTINKKNNTFTNPVIAKLDYNFDLYNITKIHLCDYFKSQFLSVATASIPAVEHNDANRALMGSNMLRQAVPILNPHKPIYSTGIESIIPYGLNTSLKSYTEGNVTKATNFLCSIKKDKDKSITYLLDKFSPSNQETLKNQTMNVWPGEEIYSGQILADSSCTRDAEFAIGKNLNVAYMPWDGLNYEDSIVISDKLIKNKSLSSLHINRTPIDLANYELNFNYNKFRNYISEDYNETNLNEFGVVKIGTVLKQNDAILIKAPINLDKNNVGKENLSSTKTAKANKSSSICIYVKEEEVGGRVIDVTLTYKCKIDFNNAIIFEKLNYNDISLKTAIITTVNLKHLQVGDKLSGRHGNKGVISKIIPFINMPQLPDGTRADIILNPLGIPSRMNVAQIIECMLSYYLYLLKKRLKLVPFDELNKQDSSLTCITKKMKEVLNLKEHKNFKIWRYFLDKNLIINGQTSEYFDNPILFGKAYFLKLAHLAEDKLYARSLGSYEAYTEQPVGGKQQDGGQRFGEMELWALEAYGASEIINELFTIKSDDISNRDKLVNYITSEDLKKKPIPFISEAFSILLRELNALGIDLVFKKINVKKIKNDNLSIHNCQDIFQSIEKEIFEKDLQSK